MGLFLSTHGVEKLHGQTLSEKNRTNLCSPFYALKRPSILRIMCFRNGSQTRKSMLIPNDDYVNSACNRDVMQFLRQKAVAFNFHCKACQNN